MQVAGLEGIPRYSRAVIPDAAKRRSGIPSGALAGEVPEWVPGLPTVARDDVALV